MKTRLSPLDIQKRRFSQKLRGYDPEDVHTFLAIVAEEFERVLREGSDLERQRDLMREELDDLSERENILKETLLSAQRVSEDIRNNAKKEAQLLVKDAELLGERLVGQAMERAGQIDASLRDLKLERQQFRSRIRVLLENFQTLMSIDDEEEQGAGDVRTLWKRAPGSPSA